MQTIPISAIILDTILKATVLLGLAWGAALVLKKRSAATRHMVRAFTLAALLLLPFSVLLPPESPVKGRPGFTRSKVSRRPPVAASSHATMTPSPSATVPAKSFATVTTQATRVRVEQRTQTLTSDTKELPVASASPVRASTSEAPVVITLAPQASTSVSPRLDAAPAAAPVPVQSQTTPSAARVYIPQIVLLLWIGGAIYFLIRWRWNALRLSTLVRRAPVLTDSGWNAQVRSLSGQLGIERHVALLVSDEIEVPITSGIMFPKVVLSPDYAEWSSQRRSAILNHELAHIRRLDAFTQALAQMVTAIYWFHPLVWLMVRAMRAERERACDDQVLASGTKASDYAHELLDIVSELRGPELAAALAMARRSQLEGRVLAVLNPSLRRGPVSWKAALGVAALTLSVMLPLAALRPAPQASTPAPKASSKKKPSPATTPGAQPNSSSAPVVAGTPSPKPDSDEDMEPAEAPEPPEMAEPPE